MMDTEIPTTVSNYSDLYERVLPTGSRVICPDHVSGSSDWDYLLLVSPEKLKELESKLLNNGWVLGGSLPNAVEIPGGDWTLNTEHEFKDGKIDMSRVFHSWKFNYINLDHSTKTVNILVTCNKEYYDDFTRATMLAKALGLTKKEDRVILFKALCQDVWEFPERPKSGATTFRWRGTFPTDSTLTGTQPTAYQVILDDWLQSDADINEAPLPTAV